MRITFACLIIVSLVSLSVNAAQDIKQVVPQEIVAQDEITAVEGIPVSVNVIQAAQVVILDQDQILSIASDITAAQQNKPVEIAEVEEESYVASEEDDTSFTESMTESTEDNSLHMNRISTTASLPLGTNSDFTFSPITLAPESSKGFIKTSAAAPAPTQSPKAVQSKTAVKKVKSSASSSSSVSIYWISTMTLSLCIMGQYLL